MFISNIVAMALRLNDPIKALEWLENSRYMIWNLLSSLQEAPVEFDFARRMPLLQDNVSFHLTEAIRQGVLHSTYVDGNRILRNLLDGPIIVLNASTVGCDALVLRPNVDPKCLHLATLSLDQVSAWEKTFNTLLSSIGAHGRRGDELDSNLERKDRPSKRNSSVDNFQILLAEIWVGLVEPILNFVWGSKDSMVSHSCLFPR